jgi:hypothetical protein
MYSHAGARGLPYTLVMMRTGRLFTVYGAPVWVSDRRGS